MRRIGADAELVGQRVSVEEPEDGLRVADVDREQHGGRDGEEAALGGVVFVREVAHPLEQVRVEMGKRASAVIGVSKLLAEGDTVEFTVESKVKKKKAKP